MSDAPLPGLLPVLWLAGTISLPLAVQIAARSPDLADRLWAGLMAELLVNGPNPEQIRLVIV